MQLCLIRHAQSIWQVDHSSGWDSALTPIGHQQARRLAHWLSNDPSLCTDVPLRVASLCVSPLIRARQTAAPVADILQLQPTPCASLREATFHVADHLPQFEDPLSLERSDTSSILYREFTAQAFEALRELVAQHTSSDGPVVAVTHGGLIKTLLRIIACSHSLCFRLYNASATLIEWRRGRWHIVHLNMVDHLPVALRTE